MFIKIPDGINTKMHNLYLSFQAIVTKTTHSFKRTIAYQI